MLYANSGAPSHYICWHSATGEAHIISQAEGGEQGDPLMPALFSLGQRAALRTMQQHLLPNEALLAFLDDVYVVVPPNRVRPVYDTLAYTLQSQASIQLKTRARDLGEDVWVGNPNLPATSQGMTVLGAPIGSAAFVQHQLQQANQQHHLEDLQASWLLLLYCASPRCTYLLRMCSPNLTTDFANNHDFAVAACLRPLLAVDDLPAQALATAHLPLSQGGLGLTCASILATPAFWSSWADSLPVLHTQLPQYAAQILEHLQHPSAAIPSIQAAAAAAQALEERGWTPPTWTELAQGIQPNTTEANTEEAPRTRGWQQQATAPINTAMYSELQAAISPASQALLQSQAGPFASRPFTTIPYSTEFEYPSHFFRILLLRRLRLHLPLTFLSVPSPSWPSWRPPRGMCSVRSLTIQRRPPRKGSSTHLQRRRGQSHHQYPTRWPQHPEPVHVRRPTHRGHRQRATNVWGQPTSSWYHFGITAYQNRGAKVTRRHLCSSSLARRTAE